MCECVCLCVLWAYYDCFAEKAVWCLFKERRRKGFSSGARHVSKFLSPFIAKHTNHFDDFQQVSHIAHSSRFRIKRAVGFDWIRHLKPWHHPRHNTDAVNSTPVWVVCAWECHFHTYRNQWRSKCCLVCGCLDVQQVLCTPSKRQ